MSFPTILRRSLPTWLVWAAARSPPRPHRRPGRRTRRCPSREPRWRQASPAARSSSPGASPPTAATRRASTPTRSRGTTAGGGCPTCPSRSTTPRRRARTEASTSSAATAAIATRSRRPSCSGRTATWRRLASLPDARAAAAAAIAGGRLYVVGGVDGRRGARPGRVRARPEDRGAGRGSPARPRASTSRPPRPGARVYAVGGRSAGIDTNTTRFEVYDAARPALDAGWPRSRRREAARVRRSSNGRIVSVGGERPQGTIAAVYAYGVGTRRWSAARGPPSPRHGLGVVAHAGRV